MKQQAVVALALLLVAVYALPEEDRVTKINGYYDFSSEFSMYSGYLTLQQTPLIASHYLFITSKDKPETDDLVLWLNGGPGCSSMLGNMAFTQVSSKSLDLTCSSKVHNNCSPTRTLSPGTSTLTYCSSRVLQEWASR